MTMTQPVVAILGLGAMGHAFATNLLKKGFTVRAWNRTRSRGEDLIALGLSLFDTPAEAVNDADVIITMLVDGAMTEDYITGSHGIISHLKQHAIIAQMATIGIPATEQLVADIAKARPDVVFLDAPVAGTKKPAENAMITVLASGDHERAAAIDPVFAAISKGAKWLGPAGNGSKMKLVVNGWLIALMQGAAETMQLAEKMGFDTDKLWDVLEGGPLAAPYVKAKFDMIKADDFTPQMHLTLAVKDAKLALDAIEDTNKMPALKLTTDIWQKAVDTGLGEEDLSSVYKYLKKQ